MSTSNAWGWGRRRASEAAAPALPSGRGRRMGATHGRLRCGRLGGVDSARSTVGCAVVRYGRVNKSIVHMTKGRTRIRPSVLATGVCPAYEHKSSI